jgi:deoxyribose-phosphate aldolase
MTDLSLLTPERLAAMIDHTFLKAFGTAADMENLCAEACRYRFACVMVNPAEIERCVGLLQGSGIPVGVTIGFPLGQNTVAVKEFEARDALKRGARELDMVINVRALQAGDTRLLRSEIAAFARACESGQALSKLILETCYLNEQEKRTACAIARDEGIGFVKTSTGMGSGGATVEDIRLMRETVGERVGVKASGGIRDFDSALAMIRAGANRIGTSSGIAIVEALRAQGSAA